MCIPEHNNSHFFLLCRCRAAYDNQNPRAAAELLGLTDETEVQKFTMPHACSLMTNFNLHIEIFVQGGEAGLRL